MRVDVVELMDIHHLNYSVRGRRALARDEAQRRRLVRTVARICGVRLLLFNIVDDHLHVVIRGGRPRKLAEALRRALNACTPGLTFEQAHVKAVETRSHMRWLVGYTINQPDHHGLGVHPALWSGSCLQDLLGVRRLPGFDPGNLRNELLRLRQRELLSIVGLPVAPLEPATNEELERAGAARIADLAAAVLGLGPRLAGRGVEQVAARALAVHACRLARIPTGVIARVLGITPRAALYLSDRDVDAVALLSLRRRLTFEERVARRIA